MTARGRHAPPAVPPPLSRPVLRAAPAGHRRGCSVGMIAPGLAEHGGRGARTEQQAAGGVQPRRPGALGAIPLRVCPAIARAHGGHHGPLTQAPPGAGRHQVSRPDCGPGGCNAALHPPGGVDRAAGCRASAPRCNAALQPVRGPHRSRGGETLAAGVTPRYSGRGARGGAGSARRPLVGVTRRYSGHKAPAVTRATKP